MENSLRGQIVDLINSLAMRNHISDEKLDNLRFLIEVYFSESARFRVPEDVQ